MGAVFTRLEQTRGARALVSLRTSVLAEEALQLTQMQLHRSSSAHLSLGPGLEHFQDLTDANAALGTVRVCLRVPRFLKSLFTANTQIQQ